MLHMKDITGIACFFLLCTASIAFAQPEGSPCMSCEEIKNLGFPEVRILEAEAVEEGVAHCRLLGVIGKEINFELLLPSEWNARFVMGGGGGFVGNIQNAARQKINEGYATVGTDTGHKGSGIKADWALNNMERQLNFGHLAVHRTAVVAKAIIQKYYCAPAKYNYFMGCSRGGGQALIEAQRYPEDFDGIVAAAPVIDWLATGAEMIRNMQALYPDPAKIGEPPLSENHLRLLQEAVMLQCDALDGLRDNLLNDPRICDFAYSVLPKCLSGQSGEDCFTPEQLEMIKTIYAGTSNRDELIYPGFPMGCESEPGSWTAWITGPHQGATASGFPSLQYAFGTEMFKYLVFNDPNWDYSKYDLTRFTEDTEFAAAFLNATSTDYRPFRAAGNKMIIWHGWNDPALSALTTIDHYEAAKKNDGQLENYMRLFLLPGVLHCGHGPGPSETDWLAHIRAWVEEGEAPYRVVVSKTNDNGTVLTRPVYPYPRVATYKGEGDTNNEENFSERKR